MAWLFRRQGLGRRGIGDGPLAVRGFEEFVTGHGCLGVVILYGWARERGSLTDPALCGGAVSGNGLPNPIPPRVRRHASLAQIPPAVRAGSREHARGDARNAMVAALYRRFAQDSLTRGGDPPAQ
ncbi:hypothetical protein GCM10010383_02560 [Streptomyces lomondensis]|uniref:Uncharacterized protein n=1 Tax=Streptomyces lomondensis TaxID=68229 RepID=A0ABQ2WV31_9ACTN|nr:hypothetical protein GCM10010383_02560 [Streptomyces lomondensis]